jgi:hypothetical protein
VAQRREQLGQSRWGFWAAELRRQQRVLANEMIRQTMSFWAKTWMVPLGGQKPNRHR